MVGDAMSAEDLGRIWTTSDDMWIVRERTSMGTPLRVDHVEEWKRELFIQAELNMALAADRFKRELRLALPAWLRWLRPEPAKFWRELG